MLSSNDISNFPQFSQIRTIYTVRICLFRVICAYIVVIQLFIQSYLYIFTDAHIFACELKLLYSQ